MRSARPRRFRLAAVLRVRKHQEDMRAQALAETQAVICKAQHRRDNLTTLQRTTLRDASELTAQKFDAGDVRRILQYERHLGRCVVDTDARLAELNAVAAGRRADLEAATRKKKAIERLKERHAERVGSENRYWEQRISDDIASCRARRKDRA